MSWKMPCICSAFTSGHFLYSSGRSPSSPGDLWFFSFYIGLRISALIEASNSTSYGFFSTDGGKSSERDEWEGFSNDWKFCFHLINQSFWKEMIFPWLSLIASDTAIFFPIVSFRIWWSFRLSWAGAAFSCEVVASSQFCWRSSRDDRFFFCLPRSLIASTGPIRFLLCSLSKGKSFGRDPV